MLLDILAFAATAVALGMPFLVPMMWDRMEKA